MRTNNLGGKKKKKVHLLLTDKKGGKKAFLINVFSKMEGKKEIVYYRKMPTI